MPDKNQKTRKQFDTRFAELKNLQQPHLGPWKDLRDYQAPNRGNFDEDKGKHGQRKDLKIYNGNPGLSARTFAAGMNANNTSKARPWFRLETEDPRLMNRLDVKEYLHGTEQVLYKIFAKSNFYAMAANLYHEIGIFGTAVMTIIEDFETVAHFETATIGEYYLATDGRGRVNTLYRRVYMTPSELIDEFGKDNVSAGVKSMFNTGSTETPIKIIHAVEPNDTRMPDMIDAKNKAFRSVYYEEGANENDGFLRISGFDRFPYVAPRWSTVSNDPYGTGQPGLLALGDSKQLQSEQYQKAEGLSRNIKPPLQAPYDVKSSQIVNVPGGISYYSPFSGSGRGITPLYEVNVPLGDLKEDIKEIETRIQNTYYVNLFLSILQNQRPQDMKAEVAFQIDKERLLMLGPVLGQLDDEWLDPTIDRVFELAQEADILPEVPEVLDGQDIKPDYVSTLAKAQKAVAINNMERLSALVGSWSAFDEGVIDKLDYDAGVDEAEKLLETPPGFVRSDEEVAVVRKAKAQTVQQQAAMGAAQAAASTAKDLAAAPVGSGNVLEKLIGVT